MDKNWPRWMFASVADYLKKIGLAQSLPVHVESLDIRSKAFTEASARVEIFITGPFITEYSKGFYRGMLDALVVATCRMDSQKNGYDLYTYAGAFQSAMDTEIPVYNLGKEEGDYKASNPDSLVLVGCFRPQYGKAISVSHFGQVHEVDQVHQVEIEGKYIIELCT